MVLRDRALPVVGDRDRCAEVLGDSDERLAAAGLHDPAAGEQHGTLCGREHLRCAGDRSAVAARPPLRTMRVRLGRIPLAEFGLQVLRELDKNRATPALEHRVEGLVQNGRQLLEAARLPPALDDRGGHRRKVVAVRTVELLQDASVLHVGVGAAGDQQERN